MSAANPTVRAFFDKQTNTVSYLVFDPYARIGAVIDPVLDYNARNGKVDTRSVSAIIAAAEEAGVTVAWVLETHAHADHLSGAPYVKLKTGAKVGIGERIREVQRVFRPIFNATDVSGDGSEFDRLFGDGETLALGGLTAEVMHTPGHTPACVSYRIGDAAFIGDTMFMPDYGTARADFPGGDAGRLYRSIHRILDLPPQTRLFLCHDYLPAGRKLHAWETTVAEQRALNIHVHEGIDEESFVAMRNARDATLPTPLLLMPAIQVNIRAGKFPPAESNGVSYVKIPVRPA